MFKSGMPVYGKEFIDRKQHIIKFNTYIKNNQHIMIKAPRRYGKTSLIVHLFEQNNYNKIYIDVKRATSLQTLAEQIIDEIYKYAGVENIISSAKESIVNLFKQLKATLKIDLSIAEFTIETLEKKDKKLINEVDFFLYAMDLVEEISKKTHLSQIAIFTRLLLNNQISPKDYKNVKADFEEQFRLKQIEEQKQKELDKQNGIQRGGAVPKPINSPLLISTIQTAFYEGVINEFDVCKTLNITPDKLDKYIQ